MDCPHKIPPLGTPAQHHKVQRNCHTRSSSRHHQDDQERGNRYRSQTRCCRHYSSSHHDLYRGHSRLTNAMGTAVIEVAQGDPIQHTCYNTDIPHTVQVIWLPLSGLL